jgi:hypothetical protein
MNQSQPPERSVRPTYYGRPASYNATRYPNRIAQRDSAPMTPEPEPIPPGDTQYDPPAPEGRFSQPGGCSHCGQGGGSMGGSGDMYGGCGDCGSGCGCGDCGDCCGDSCGDCGGDCGYPCFTPGFCFGPRNLSIFAGVQGFKGPQDRGRNGNFGFNEGVNWGAPLGDPWGCGYQLGFQALQSDFSGQQVGFGAPANTTNAAETSDRHQYFFTGGIFRRAECNLEWGIAFDLLHDTYYRTADLKQLRTEVGWWFSPCCEIGYSGAYRLASDTIENSFGRNIDGKLDPTDQFVAFARRVFENGGEGRIWAGATGEGDGLVGADCWIPLGRGFALQNSFNYLVPNLFRGNAADPVTGVQTGGEINESWNLSINLVWYIGKDSQCVASSCYRPLLPIADNGQFMVKEKAVQTGQ